MTLKIEDKQAIVAEVAQRASQATSAAIFDYRGLTAAQVTQMRKAARDEYNVDLTVVRNTLARRALKDTSFSCMESELVGPTMLAFSNKEPSAPARLFKEYAKQFNKLNVKALSVGGQLLSADKVDYVAKLPTRNEAIATLMQVMKAPIEKFVRTLAEPHAKFVRTLAAVRDQKQAAQ